MSSGTSNLTLEDILGICKDFEPIRCADGVVRCKHLQPDNLCVDTTRFECELIGYRRRKKERNHTSYSRIGTFLGCPRKFYFRYVSNVPIEKTPAWAFLGKAFHVAAARIASGLAWDVPEIPEDCVASEADRICLQEALRWFEEHRSDFPMPEECEVPCKVQTNEGRTIIGALDGWRPSDGTIIEYKYGDSDINEHTQKRQLSFYFGTRSDAGQAAIIQVLKLRLHLKKGETLDEFRARVREEVDKRGKEGRMVKLSKFFRYEFPILDELAAADGVHRMIDLCRDTGVWPCNYSIMECRNCDYYNHCRTFRQG